MHHKCKDLPTKQFTGPGEVAKCHKVEGPEPVDLADPHAQQYKTPPHETLRRQKRSYMPFEGKVTFILLAFTAFSYHQNHLFKQKEILKKKGKKKKILFTATLHSLITHLLLW